MPPGWWCTERSLGLVSQQLQEGFFITSHLARAMPQPPSTGPGAGEGVGRREEAHSDAVWRQAGQGGGTPAGPAASVDVGSESEGAEYS